MLHAGTVFTCFVCIVLCHLTAVLDLHISDTPFKQRTLSRALVWFHVCTYFPSGRNIQLRNMPRAAQQAQQRERRERERKGKGSGVGRGREGEHERQGRACACLRTPRAVWMVSPRLAQPRSHTEQEGAKSQRITCSTDCKQHPRSGENFTWVRPEGIPSSSPPAGASGSPQSRPLRGPTPGL